VVVPPDFQQKFPLLTQDTFRPDSPPTPAYNCIAWAAGDDTVWWEPSQDGFWPPGVPRELSVAAFVAAFGTLGYVVCPSDVPESDFEKIALYADFTQRPTHAARQLPDGTWTSKLGRNVDIVHSDPRVLQGPEYGHVVQFMRRRKSSVSNIAL